LQTLQLTVDRKKNPDINVVSIKCKYVYCLFVAFLRNKSYLFVKIHVHFLKTFFEIKIPYFIEPKIQCYSREHYIPKRRSGSNQIGKETNNGDHVGSQTSNIFTKKE